MQICTAALIGPSRLTSKGIRRSFHTEKQDFLVIINGAKTEDQPQAIFKKA